MERVGGRPRRDPTPTGQRRAFSAWQGPVETGGDAREAAFLRTLFDVDPSAVETYTHGFHPYAARLPPSLVGAAIDHWSKPGATIADPFCGSGTTLVEAAARRRRAIGADASPLAVEVARTRTTVLGPDGRRALVAIAQSIAEDSADSAQRRARVGSIPKWARRQHDNFHPHVFLELIGLRSLIFDREDIPDDVARALRVGFSAILVKFLKAGPQAPRDSHDKRIGRGIPSLHFARRVLALAEGLEALEKATGATPPPLVIDADARACPQLGTGGVDLVVTSPPYAGVYDYAEQHDLRYAWLGLDPRKFQSRQIGARTRGPGTDPRAFREDRRRYLGEIARMLLPGGHALLVVGDGILGIHPEDAGLAHRQLGPDLGLTAVAWGAQPRPPRDRLVREIFGGMPRNEHVLLLRKI
jgi:SAM-dependent methyltransferase